MLLTTTLISWISKIVNKVEQPTTYGSELERYIVSKRPQSVYEVEHWTNQFDKNNTKGWMI